MLGPAGPFSVETTICRHLRRNEAKIVAPQHLPACIFFIYTRNDRQYLLVTLLIRIFNINLKKLL